MREMTVTQIERARNREDKKVVEGGKCQYCGGNSGNVITYYDTLAQDRTCIDCQKTY